MASTIELMKEGCQALRSSLVWRTPEHVLRTKEFNGEDVNRNGNLLAVQDHALNHLDSGIKEAVRR